VSQAVSATTQSADWLAETGALYASVSSEPLVVSSAAAQVVGATPSPSAPAKASTSFCDQRCIIVVGCVIGVAVLSCIVAVTMLVCRRRKRATSVQGSKPVPQHAAEMQSMEGPAMLFSKSGEFNPEVSTEPFFDDSNAEGFVPDGSTESLGVAAPAEKKK